MPVPYGSFRDIIDPERAEKAEDELNSRRLPGLSGVVVIAAYRTASNLALGLPDVAQVVTLGHADDHGRPAASSHGSRPRDRP